MQGFEEEIKRLEMALQRKCSLRDVSLQVPDEQTRLADSLTTLYCHSPESSSQNSLECISGGVLQTTNKPRLQQFSASSSECFDQVDAGISFDDVRWLIQKKADIGFECKALQKEKEKLRHEIAKLQSLRQLRHFPMMGQPQFMNVALVQDLYVKLHSQEQRQKDLVRYVKQQHQLLEREVFYT